MSAVAKGDGVDPVSLVVGALAAGAAGGLTESASAAVTGAYAALRDRLRRLFTADREAAGVLELHEGNPDVYQEPLRHVLARSGAAGDYEVVAAAQYLMTLLDAAGSAAGKYSVDVRGAQGVQVGDGNTQTNTFTAPPPGT
ncbi:RIP homotypic interaction motif-containing protein [Frankia sp. Cppng1_Ct_nod]|uniref:RIP homotypic interaction motif-containing protein n=1 Tax=Frankia sp. Cppng1_Ct_nod TaxID=2897162 RepID=UPI001A94EB92|nr:RIP homotypic interaction motif-containing protein [Frankia sp. Cppng1_Ct_nod]